MQTAVSTLELIEPRSLKDALRHLRDDESLVPIAGCTDVFVDLNFGTRAPARYLNLWRLDPLRRIETKRDRLRIGALCTYTQMIRSQPIQRQLPMLVEAARTVGGIQIQNRGTLGGNIANGSPAGDTLPVLAAAEAEVVLQSADDTRRVPFLEYFTGYRQSVRRPDELIVAVEIPRQRGTQWFHKVGTRAAQAISKVVVAAVRADPPRIAVGSVAPTVVRLEQTEHALAQGAGPDQAAEIARTEIRPIDDLRSTARYRLTVTGNLVRRFWRETDPNP